MFARNVTLILFIFCVCTMPVSARADVILQSITGSLSASINPGPPATATNLLPTGSISQTFNGPGNNFTTSNETHTWSSTGQVSFSLAGSGTVTEAKTLSAGPGGIHDGTSSLTVVFTTTAATDWSMSGTYGYVQNTNGRPDSISWSLVGPGTNLGQSAVSQGGASQPFFGSQQLGVGTYTFTISADLNERIINPATRSANWSLNAFSLTSLAAVPESAPLPIVCAIVFLGVGLATRRLALAR